MPELPEVEATCRRLSKGAVGAVIKDVEVLRARSVHPQKPGDAAHAVNGKILRVERRGKNILLPLSNGWWLRVHLGMTGHLQVIPDARTRTASTRVVFALTDGRGLVLEDSRVFGRAHLFTKEQVEKLHADLGVEPLSKQFTPEYLVGVAKVSAKPMKILLMDQRYVSGLGNIYAAEALYEARINPKQIARRVRPERMRALHAAIVAVIKKAIQVTTKSYRKPGYFEESRFQVYGRSGEPCRRCGTKIKRVEQAARSTFFCPKCQR